MLLLDRYNNEKGHFFRWIIFFHCFIVSKLSLLLAHPDDTLCDGSSFGKPCTSLVAHSFKIHAKQLIFTFAGNFQANRLIFKSMYSSVTSRILSWQHKYQPSRADLSVLYRR